MIDLRVLGPPDVAASDLRSVHLLTRRPRRFALLAYLAAATPRGGHRRDKLLALFWPEADDTHARAALSQAIYVLRSSLGAEAILSRGNDEVELNRDVVECDVVAFEAELDAGRPGQALALYRGDLLDGFFIGGAPDFEQWLDRERDRLRQRAAEGAWALAATASGQGDREGAIRWARRAADLLPDDEAVVRRLMTFLHDLGDRAAAIRAYEAFAWRLSDEYELLPSAETQRLAATIRQEDRRPRVARATRGPPASVPAAPARVRGTRPARRRSAILRNRWVATSGVVGFVAVLMGAAWLWARESDVRRARSVALPEAMHLIAQGNTFQAFRLLREAALHVPDDPTLEELLVESTIPVTIRTIPPDADVYVRDFFDEPDAWEFLDSAPLEDVRLPIGLVVARVSRQGFQPKEVMRFTEFGEWHLSLQPADRSPPEMVHVNGGRLELFATEVTLGDFWIDQYEVTNEAFKSFVDQGGYDQQEFWTERIVVDGKELDRDASSRLFRDRTGRPGPATWSVGTYPDGEANEPVGGVSWYEAAAYCASVGKRLPTIYHWYRAAVLPGITDVVSLGNFGSSGPEEVGHPLRLGFRGTYDMAGNVKEWVWNEASGDRRYILGGGWTEPSYTFHDADAQRPWDREPTYGIRCARYPTSPPPDQTSRLARASRDWRQETPAADDFFAVYRGLYEYDRTPLDPHVVSVREEFEHWSVEHVSFSAPYGNERIPARIFLPTDVRPPYQTVIYFPGASAFRRSPAGEMSGEEYWFLFMVRSGRAVVVPVYKGAYERYVGPTGLPNIWRDVMVYAGKDLRRAVDYVESRPDLDAERLAYFGLSMGAAVGPIMTAVEPRFAASILLGGGLYSWQRPPESEQFHFAPRVTAPTLMINGRHDFFFPLETSQEPMFELLDTPDKKHVVFDSGHIPREREDVMREVLDWLDRYLAPVERR